MTTSSAQPTDEDRRRAVCLVMGRATVLIRYASRYVQCVDDAEDAYQRAMEIALTKAPTTEHARFLAWLYTVVRNEAIAVAKERSRQRLGRIEDAAQTADATANDHSPERSAEWRERYRAVQDALGSLSEQQRTCLMLQSAGMSYGQIAESTGFSHRQIERAISRGRSRLHAWEDKLESGAACNELQPALERVVAREASDLEIHRVGRHVRVCTGCRLSMRQRLGTTETLAALVPLAVIADAAGGAPGPDPGLAVAYWERVSGASMARAGQLLTAMVELPSAGLARAGGAAAALAVAGLAVLPIAAEQLPGVWRESDDPAPRLQYSSTESSRPSAVVLTAARAAVAAAAAKPGADEPREPAAHPPKPRPAPRPARPAVALAARAPAPTTQPVATARPVPTPSATSTAADEFAP